MAAWTGAEGTVEKRKTWSLAKEAAPRERLHGPSGVEGRCDQQEAAWRKLADGGSARKEPSNARPIKNDRDRWTCGSASSFPIWPSSVASYCRLVLRENRTASEHADALMCKARFQAGTVRL